MESTVIAVDIAKSVFEIAVSEVPGVVAGRHRLSRAKFERFLREHAPATLVMEACGMAHYWGRQVTALGHRVVLLPPHTIRPYVTRNKTDRTDAKGILEAYRNQDIKPVPVKTEDQQALAALHRVRACWVETRTARLNALRGMLRELGYMIPVGAVKVVPYVWDVLSRTPLPIPALLAPVLAEVCQEIESLEDRIAQVDRQLKELIKTLPDAQRLRTIRGIGLLGSTALVAFYGDVTRFPSGRHFSSSLGITPREDSTGHRRRLGRISKLGNSYLRTLLIHGARAVLVNAARAPHPDRLQKWALMLAARRGHNRATVALANHLARVVWAVWRSGGVYQAQPTPAQTA